MFTAARLTPSLARSYATAAKVKLPLQLEGLSAKYANAAFLGAANKSSQAVSQVESDLSALGKMIEAKDESVSFLDNPTLSLTERSAQLETLFKRFPKANEITNNLLSTLSANGRLTSTSEVIKDFIALAKAQKGELEVIVTSAEPLEKSVLDRLEKTLKGSQVASGKTMKVVNKVNPSVLGGLIVDFGDKTIDLSASSKVNQLNALLGQSV